MRSIVSNWAKRYYFTGLGLPIPNRLKYEDYVYEAAFAELLEDPIKQILGKQEITDQDISSFLKAYQETGIRSPFYMLGLVANAYQPSSDLVTGLKNAVAYVIQGLVPAVGIVPHGKNIPIYADDKGSVYGVFPNKVHYICPAYTNDGNGDIASELLAMNPMNLTESDISTMKRICRVNKDYAGQLRAVTLEVRQGAYFVQSRVTPLDKNFPPYEIRQLMSLMPKTSEYSSQHEAIYEFVKRSNRQDEFPNAYAYLSEIFKNEPEPVVMPSEVEYPPNTAAFTLPNEAVSFNGLDELLQYYMNDGVILPYWTVKDVINFFASDTAPVPVAFNPDMRALDAMQAGLALHIVRVLKKFIPDGVDLEKALRDVSQGKPMPTAPSATEVFNSVVAKYNIDLDKYAKQMSPQDLAQHMLDAGADPQLNINEIAQGINKHIPKVYQTKEELLESSSISPELRNELQPQAKDVKSLALEMIALGANSELSLVDLARGKTQVKKKTLKDLVQEFTDLGYTPGLTIDDIIAGRDTPIRYDSIEELEAAGMLSPEFKVPRSTAMTEFGYVAAESMLADIREGIVSLQGKSFAETNAYKSKLVPIYYGYLRLLAFDADKSADALEYLDSLYQKVDPDVKGCVEKAIQKVREVVS